MAIQPRLGPSQFSAETLANQAFRTSGEKLARLPAQWRGAVVNRLRDGITVDQVLALIDRGDVSGDLEPHDTFLSFAGQEI